MTQQECVDRYSSLRQPEHFRFSIVWHGDPDNDVFVHLFVDPPATGAEFSYGWAEVVCHQWLAKSSTEAVDRWFGWIFDRMVLQMSRQWMVFPDGTQLQEHHCWPMPTENAQHDPYAADNPW